MVVEGEEQFLGQLDCASIIGLVQLGGKGLALLSTTTMWIVPRRAEVDRAMS